MQIKPLFSGRAYYEITGDDGQKYVYTPQEFVEKGFVQGKVQNYDPVFMDKKDEVLSKASSFTLPEGLSVNSAASKLYKEPSKGIIWKAEDFAPYSDKGKYYFTQYNISDKSPAITGLSEVNGKTVYLTNAQPGYDYGYISGTKTGQTDFQSIRQARSGGGGLFGGLLGDIANPILEDVGNLLIEGGPALQLANFVVPGLGTGLAAGTALGKGDITGAVLSAAIGEATGNSMFTEGGGMPIWASADPNAVGGVTGPDNIDVGGGWSPAGTAPITVDAITQQIQSPAAEQIAAEQSVVQMSAEQFAAEQAAAEEAARIAAENAAYDQAMQDLAKDYVSPQFATATAAAAQGMTFKQGLDAVRAGLLINAITGDPLGLSDTGGGGGGGGGGGASGTTGFAQVPIPAEWKSPTYTYSPVQNVTFEDLFPEISLKGTQWRGMQLAEPNMTFNEMFASGLQKTPMGSPVDINQIVGAIVGQGTKS